MDTYVDEGRTAEASFLAKRNAFTSVIRDAGAGQFALITFTFCLALVGACGTNAPIGDVPPGGVGGVIGGEGGAAQTSGAGGATVPATDGGNATSGVPILICDGGAGTIQFKLPCQMGMPSLFAVECDTDHGHFNFLWGFPLPDGSGVVPINSSFKPLSLNQPTDFQAVPTTGASVTSAGQAYGLTSFRGQAVFLELNLIKPAFLARLVNAQTIWTASDGSTLECTLTNGLLWAVPGNFF